MAKTTARERATPETDAFYLARGKLGDTPEGQFARRMEHERDEAREALRSKVSADSVIAKIIRDIKDRRGIGDEWDGIDVDVRREIVATWRTFFTEKLPAAPKGGSK